MKIEPALRINLSHHDLQQIYNAALDAVKNTSNTHIDTHLHPIACTIAAFVDYVNAQAMCIHLTQPSRLPMQPSNDD